MELTYYRRTTGQLLGQAASMAPDRPQRKLTTILAADVVGYSQLMASDEEGTLATLQTYSKITEALVTKHNGRIFNTAGDAFLAEFGSAVEAVRCAISIQEDLAVRNAELPEQKQMWFRIGINVGDVMIEKNNLFGDGVNVAARLEALAEKGGICISGSTFDQVKNKLSIALDDIGAQKVKNIPDPVSAFRLVPGKISVKAEARPALSRRFMGIAGLNRHTRLAAGAATVAILLGGAYLANLLPFANVSKSPFDGHWKVTVDSLAGCLNNDPRSFPLTVSQGKIDMKDLRYPKTGSVLADGTFRLKSIDQSGNHMNTQTGTLSGNSGKGSFFGRKPSCRGAVTLLRSDQ